MTELFRLHRVLVTEQQVKDNNFQRSIGSDKLLMHASKSVFTTEV
jgi:hypothetical protein